MSEVERRATRVAELSVSLVENSADLVALFALDGTVLYVNEAGATLLQIENRAAAGVVALPDFFLAEDASFVRDVVLRSVAGDGRWNGDTQLRNAKTGTGIAAACSLYYTDDDAGVRTAIAMVAHDIRERGRADRRLRVLVDAGASLSHSLDYVQTLQNLSELVVGSLASYCMIDLFETHPSGATTIKRVASAHADRAMNDRLAEVRNITLPLDRGAHPVTQIFRDGSSSLVADVDEAWIQRVAVSPEHAQLYRELGVRSIIAVPLVANGEILGSLLCALGNESNVRQSRPYRYDAEDLFFAEEIGRRAGVAIDNARRYEREHHIALVMQSASLPQGLPDVGYLRLDAEYCPGSGEATIGGDWYDAFALDDGRFALTVGDVLGHGLEAGVTMTKLRQAMQTAALLTPDPLVMLDAADRLLRQNNPAGYATALAAIYDPRTQRMIFACAGHPGPMLRTADGHVEELKNPGVPVGLVRGPARVVREVATPAHSMLVFFTDGLVEATHDLNEGYRRLREALASSSIAASEHPAAALVRSVLHGDEPRDDVAVLVATVTGG